MSAKSPPIYPGASTSYERRKPRVRKYKAPYPRERMRDFTNHGTLQQRHYSPPGTELSWSPEVRQMGPITGGVALMRDTVTPGARSIIKAGGVVNTPMSSYRILYGYLMDVPFITTTANNSYQIQGTGPVLKNWFGTFGPTWVPKSGTAPDNSELTTIEKKSDWLDVLAIKTYSRVEPPETFVGVTLAEAGKTVDLITSTARRFAKGVVVLNRAAHSLRKGNFSYERLAIEVCREMGIPFDAKRFRAEYRRHLKRGMGEITSTWLAVRYGWTPLISDIVTTLAALTIEKSSGRKTARGKLEDVSTSVAETSNIRFGASAQWGKYSYTITTTANLLARGFVVYDYTATPWGGNLRSFGITHPLSTVWELVPFSFVIDWFANVGDWLEAMESKAAVNIITSGYTYQKTVTYQRRIGPYVRDQPSTQFSDPGWSYLTEEHEKRIKTRGTSLTLPVRPQLTIHINVKRAIDAIALLHQAGGRRYRT